MVERLIQSEHAKKMWDFRPGVTVGGPEGLSLQQKAKILWDFHQDEISNYITNLTTDLPTEQTRAIIFGQGRSGSTLLENLICSSRYFKQAGELLSPYYKTINRHGIRIHQGEPLFPSHYIHGLLKKQPDKNFIFHLKVYHLTEERCRPVNPKRILRTFYDHGWKIIFLRRRNRIKHVLSDWVRDRRGRPHKKDDENERYRLQIDCDVFAEMVQGREKFEAMERDCLASMDFHEVVYDDDLEDASRHQSTVDGIFQFLQMPSVPVSTRYRKVNTQSMEDLIINYDEFKASMIAHGWGESLD